MSIVSRPLILLRGFGGPDVADERQSAYQGFNDGTVYPKKRGENFIYEGFVLRALKSPRYRYVDATNVVSYLSRPAGVGTETGGFAEELLQGHLVLDPRMADEVLGNRKQAARSLWVYRYYDLPARDFDDYAANLLRLIDIIRAVMDKRGAPFGGVDIVAHSMGGLIVREALHMVGDKTEAEQLIHRVVTLGTPHRGIAFQRVPRWLLAVLPRVGDAAEELEKFSASSTEFQKVSKLYSLERILTVAGTNYRTYKPVIATHLNRLSNLFDGESLETNRSDGLVKHSAAQLPGAPRTFVDKCHGGNDSLVTSRESYEIAMRFFHGTHHVKLCLDEAKIKQGTEFIGESDFYFGVRIKPRFTDFELFHQSAEAENCYGPFRNPDLTDLDLLDLRTELNKTLDEEGDDTTGWAGPERLVWEGWIDERDKPETAQGLVFRLDVYVGERDRLGKGFSDNVVFHKQFHVQAFPNETGPTVFIHPSEQYLGTSRSPGTTESPLNQEQLAAVAADPNNPVQEATRMGNDWRFEVEGTGFKGTFRLCIRRVSPRQVEAPA
jgi:pimeloyl-ACP methyl ester carboxylesterase